MDPITLAMLLSAGSSSGAVGALGQFINVAPTMFRTSYDKYNKEQLERLERLKEEHKLGISSKQKQVIREGYLQPALGALNAQTSALPGSPLGGTSAGSDFTARLQGAQATTNALSTIVPQANAAVQAANQGKRSALKQEIEDRTSYRSARQQEQLAAGMSILGAGLQSGTQSAEQKKLTGGGTAASVPATSMPAAMPGVYQSQMSSMPASIQSISSDPEMQQLLMSVLAGGI